MQQFPANTTALIVDDEPSIVAAIEFLLQQEGIRTFTAFDGATAIELATAHRPDVVLLDVMMPGGIDGFEVARRIRRLPDLEHARIIFLTARGAQGDKVEGYSSGGEHYLIKPFDNDDLVATVAEVAAYG